MYMQVEDETTARQLFTAQPGLLYDTTPRDSGVSQPPALPPPAQQPEQPQQQPLSTADEEAEVALQYLEAEWAMRMEAPLSALAGLEESITRQIEAAQQRLPL